MLIGGVYGPLDELAGRQSRPTRTHGRQG